MLKGQPAEYPPPPSRVGSIDVFRGITMLLMLFVNDIGDIDLGHIQNAPGWLKHMPGAVDGMTVADVIFPCFLFIVGLSIPVSLGHRLAFGESLVKVSARIVARSLALIFIGLCMVNSCHGVSGFDVAAMGMTGTCWRLLMFAGVIGFWSRYPKAAGAKRLLFLALRVLAASLLVYLLAVYRVNQDGAAVWMRPRWWGILGLIGWAYLGSALVWLVCRNRGGVLLGFFAVLIAMNIGLRYGAMGWWDMLFRGAHGWIPSLRLVSNMSMAVAGMSVAAISGPASADEPPRRRVGGVLLFGLGFAVSGWLLRQPWGIHKSGGTPAWILLSLAIACAVYALLYWLIDVKKITRWSSPFALAGSNTLLMYMLPYVFYSALSGLGIDGLQTHLSEGWLGVARSAAVALLLMGTTSLLTRMGMRLKV